MKPSLAAHVAVVTLKEGEPREIHYDIVQCLSHGFNFVREDGGYTFLSSALILEIESVPGSGVVGSA